MRAQDKSRRLLMRSAAILDADAKQLLYKSAPTLQPFVPLPTAPEIDRRRLGLPALAPAQQ
jgi:hypothetical protein